MKTKVNAGSRSIFRTASLFMLIAVFASFMPVVKAAADTTPPNDVEGVIATSSDGAVVLKWDAATDNTGVTGYKIYFGTTSVSVDGSKYELAPIDAGNKLTYRISGLTNGVTYYFALTAYDAAKNESENYSAEVSATPGHGVMDSESPKVTRAVAINNQTVKITFSENVLLPEVAPEAAFLIKNDATQAALEVKKAELDPTDVSGQTVLLETGTQKTGDMYIVTAGIQIKDQSNNPIISGTSDTAIFAGSAAAPVAPVTQQTTQTHAAATSLPEIVKVEVKDTTHVIVFFSKELDAAPSALSKENFIITEADNTDKFIDVKSVINTVTAGKSAITIETAVPLEVKSYNLIVVDVKDKEGNLISVDRNATVFEVKSSVVGTQQTQPGTQQTQNTEDQTAPEDVTNFMAKIVENMIVSLTWSASLNKTGDLANYMLYKSTDGLKYDNGIAISPKAISFDLSDLIPGMKYFFKLTARDTTGNESKGVTTSFTLPATGPELGLLVLGSLGISRLMRKRKAKK